MTRARTAAGSEDPGPHPRLDHRAAHVGSTWNARVVTDAHDVVTVERLVPAPPGPIFELLVHPNRHRDIDGSGAVRDPKGDAKRLRLGSRFGMSMRIGLPYSMMSTVIEFEEGRRIAWRTTGPGPVGGLFGGRIWRYELEPVDASTLVRESWDITGESLLTKPIVRRSARQTRKNMETTLERIEKLVTS